MQKECILLNKIFEGSYTDNISNISHEIIDFFKADDGKYYVYNNPFGDFGNHNKNYTPTYLLLTSSYIPKEKKVKIFYLIKLYLFTCSLAQTFCKSSVVETTCGLQN